MENISEEELNERVAILRRFRTLLEAQRQKFQEYLTVLEKQGDCIEADNTEALAAHAELEQQIVKGISSLQKVIVPMSEMYQSTNGSIRESDRKSVESIQKDLNRLQARVLEQNEKNRELLRSHLVSLRQQIESFRNPYRNVSSVYAKKVAQGKLVTVEV